MRRLLPLLLVVALPAFACGGDDDGSHPADGGITPTADADPNAPDADPSAPDADPTAPDADPAAPDASMADANPNCMPVVGTPTLGVEDVAGAFAAPVAAVVPPGGDRRIFIVEKAARQISIYKDGVVLPTPFLDASNVVIVNDVQAERGLLGLAFAADYASSGRFFIYYTSQAVPAAGIAEGDNVLAEYHVSAANPDVAAPTGTLLLHQAKQNTDHNGGWLAVGPDDMLYLSLGDDTLATPSQELDTFLGKILRLDVSGAAGSYAIPADNPFVGMGGGVKGEIWVYGLRNPWRDSFDRATGDLYIGDVGANTTEEVNVVPAGSGGGQNFGWPVMEGSMCVGGGLACNHAGMTPPIHEYPHAGANAAITGGYVYRGCDMPALAGTYFFADSYQGNIRSFRWNGASGINSLTSYPQFDGRALYSWGEDPEGELLLLDGSDGHMYRLVPQ